MKKTETEQTALHQTSSKTDNVRISSIALTINIGLLVLGVLAAILLDAAGVPGAWIVVVFSLIFLAALVIVPSSAVDTMNLGELAGMTALAQAAPAADTKNLS